MTERTGEAILYPWFSSNVDDEEQRTFLESLNRWVDVGKIHGRDCVQGFGPLADKLTKLTQELGKDESFVTWRDHPAD